MNENEWMTIPAAERFELLATIREMREWRYDDAWPDRLGPIQRAALELHRWRQTKPDKTLLSDGRLL